MVTSPRIDALRFPHLEAGNVDALTARDVFEGLRFDGVTFDSVNLTDAVFSESILDKVRITDSVLRGIRLSETRIAALDAPILAAPLSQWRDVELVNSRIGSGELFEATISSVIITGCKIGYLNLRGAELTNVIISDCTLDELDLGGATLKKVAITGCQIGTLDVTRSTMSNTDLRGTTFQSIMGLAGLRGATIDEDQLGMLAPHLAHASGLLVE